MKKTLTFISCLLPSKIAVLCLRLLGHKIDWSCKIGFSFIYVNKLNLGQNCKIGHLNFIKIDEIIFQKEAYIGKLNIIKGPLSLNFDKKAALGNLNTVVRASLGVTYGKSELRLGELTKITARHYLDLTNTIDFGENSILAGAGSQIWTHGYIHAQEGPDRIRVDGSVKLGNNVYIGSQCIVNAGVTVNNAITVGSNSTISKDLIEPGMYVGQKLRFLDKNIKDVMANLEKVEIEGLREIVYKK
ncbi:acyltransferase [Lacinutrix chionoecetis]